ncbi:MAG: dephospho-CoA kinase [Chloroflexi bacterium]|nr:dephospho-CoA kinase [Chloroflexota bacterium]
MAYAGKYIIGVTGPIGAGKSTVLRILRELGAEVIDADQVAREVMEPGGRAYEKVVRAFGPDILTSDGRIDRQRLAQVVFNDPEALRRLEAIVHPAVFEEIKQRIAQSPRPIVALEAIKLLEAGLSITICDEVWVIIVDKDVQLERLRERGMSEEDARRRMAAQLSPEEYIRHADVVIDNSRDLAHLRAQVERAWQRALQRARQMQEEHRTEETS